jgi:hypothetical protein
VRPDCRATKASCVSAILRLAGKVVAQFFIGIALQNYFVTSKIFLAPVRTVALLDRGLGFCSHGPGPYPCIIQPLIVFSPGLPSKAGASSFFGTSFFASYN